VFVLTAANADDNGGTQRVTTGPILSALPTTMSNKRLKPFLTPVDVHRSRPFPVYRFDRSATAVRLPTKAHSLAEVHLLFSSSFHCDFSSLENLLIFYVGYHSGWFKKVSCCIVIDISKARQWP